MSKNGIEEEVTITPVIRDLERLINRIFRIVWWLISGILIGANRFFAFNFKRIRIIIPIAVLGVLFGLFSTYFIPRQYKSELLLSVNIEAENQLYNDISFFNSLVEEGRLKELSNLFNISEEEAAGINDFELKPYSTYRERLEVVNQMYKELDSATYEHIDFERILEDEFQTISSRFVIIANSTDEKLFPKIEKSMLLYLERVPELQAMKEVERANLRYERKILIEEMNNLDTLKRVYNKAIIEKAKAGKESAGAAMFFGQQQQDNSLNPLDIYNKYLYYSKEVTKLDKKLANLERCYAVQAHFSEVGTKSGPGLILRSVFAVAFGLLIYYFFVAVSTLTSSYKETSARV